MYKIGDKVVYPMHGAGVIVGIENKEILGEQHKYYVMKMPIGDMNVMIPFDHAQEIGVRDVCAKEVADRVMDILKHAPVEVDANWNKRYRDNMMKIKSGDICEVACVVKRLLKREAERGLSTGERKMLNSAKQILMSEMVLVQGIDRDEIERVFATLAGKDSEAS